MHSRTAKQGCSPNNTKARPSIEALEDRLVMNSGPIVDLSGIALSSSHATDHILVQYLEGATPVALPGTTVGSATGLVDNLYRVNLSSQLSVDAALSAYRADKRVANAEADVFLLPRATSNDPSLSQQSGLQAIGAPAAWNKTTGSMKVVVAVMDTGIDYRHPDLYQNIWVNQGEIPAAIKSKLLDIDDDKLITFRDLNDSRNKGAGKAVDVNANGRIDGGDLLAAMSKGGWADSIDTDNDGHTDDIIGWNFVENNNNPLDTLGHGTHVAGVIGASGNNGLGGAGVAWNVGLMPVRFMGNGGGTISDFIAGLNYSIKHGAKISNNSWTGGSASQILINAVTAAKNADQVFVAAAGNSHTNNDVAPVYPASLGVDNIISVAAVDGTGKLDSFSNYGPKSVDLAAPGDNVLSTQVGGGYIGMSGTSVATPFVSGVVALVRAQNPTWTYKQVIDRVLNTVEKNSALVGKVATAGIVDAAAAVGASTAPTPVATAPKITSASILGPNIYTMYGIRVVFDQTMLTSSFTLADVSIIGPDGKPLTPTSVRESYTGRIYDIGVPLQTKVGTYTVKIGPNVMSAVGVNMVAYTGTLKLPVVTATPAPAKIISATATGPNVSSMNTIRVTYDKAIDKTTFTTADASLVLPGGATIGVSSVTEVVGSAGKSFDIVFATQTLAGNYTLKVGATLKDTTGLTTAAYTGTFTLPRVAAPAPKVASTTPTGTATSLTSIRLTFDQAIALSTFTTADVQFKGPGGVIIPISAVKVVIGSGDKSFDVTFPTQTATGTYTLTVGPNVKNLSGTDMVPFQKTYTIGSVGTYSSTRPVTIPTGGRGVSVIQVADSVRIGDINVTVNITFPRMGDLYIHLQAPDGSDLILSSQLGGPTANMKGTVFDDEAASSIALGRGPYTGSFQPMTSLSALDGRMATGMWLLWVEDRGGNFTGTIDSWSIKVTPKV